MTSPFGASAILRDKNDKSLRMIFDHRALNKLTRKDKYTLPLIDEMLDKLATLKYFPKMDLSSGFTKPESKVGTNLIPHYKPATDLSNGQACL